jgi:hypothetical protein
MMDQAWGSGFVRGREPSGRFLWTVGECSGSRRARAHVFSGKKASAYLTMVRHRELGIDLLAQYGSVWYNPALAAAMRG